jgi:hypothetical protein
VASKKAKTAKVAKVMGEYKRGTLKSSSGKKVSSRKQAVAIAMSEAKMPKKKSGKKPPIPKEAYDRPINKRQPRNKDEIITSGSAKTRGKRTVYRGKSKYTKLPPPWFVGGPMDA